LVYLIKSKKIKKKKSKKFVKLFESNFLNPLFAWVHLPENGLFFAKTLKNGFLKKTTLRVCSLFENKKPCAVGLQNQSCTIPYIFYEVEKVDDRREYPRFEAHLDGSA